MTTSKPGLKEVQDWHESIWIPYVLKVAEVDIVADREERPDLFPDGMGGDIRNFVEKLGRLPHAPEEVDAYESGTEEWLEWLVENGHPLPEGLGNEEVSLDDMREGGEFLASLVMEMNRHVPRLPDWKMKELRKALVTFGQEYRDVVETFPL